jgi:vacuolar-type H+-ATPase subunit D/Vma8
MKGERRNMRKVFCTVLTFVLVVSLFAPLSFAAEDDYFRISREVDETNQKIEEMIDKAIEDAENAINAYKEEVKSNNKDSEGIGHTIKDKKDALNKEIQRIIERLVTDTNELAAKMVSKAAEAGIIVECEYVEVEIGNQKVLVDPLIVVGF